MSRKYERDYSPAPQPGPLRRLWRAIIDGGGQPYYDTGKVARDFGPGYDDKGQYVGPNAPAGFHISQEGRESNK